MNIPNIPSDNIYKFIALTSLIILIVAAYFFEISQRELNIKLIELEGDEKILSMESEGIVKKSNELINKCKILDKEWIHLDTLKTVLTNEDFQNYLNAFEKFKSVKKETKGNKIFVEETMNVSLNELFKSEFLELNELFRAIQINLIRQKVKIDTIMEVSEQREYLKSIYNYVLFPLIILVLIGFYLWYQKVQRYQDIILRIQAQQIMKQKE